MSKQYFKCINPFCIYKNWTVWYAKEVPSNPSCNECTNEYTETWTDDDNHHSETK